MTTLTSVLLLLAHALGLALPWQAAPASTPAPAAWRPESIPWQEVNADGTKYAVLEGRRDVAGQPFTYAFFVPAGVWDGPHHHTGDARVFVAEGALRLGYGRALDKARTTRYPAGSVLVVPAGAVHFDGAEVDTLIIGVGMGSWSTEYVAPGRP